jgi:hypothetical protein
VNRAVVYWGDPRYTQGDSYISPGPAWWLGAVKFSGEWTNCSWHVADSEVADVGWSQIYVDHSLLTNDITMRVLLFDQTNASLFVDLLDSNAVVVATNLYENLLTGSNEAVEVQVTVPLTNYPTASTIQFRRGTGEITVYRSVLEVMENHEGLGANQETQPFSSKATSVGNANGFGSYSTDLANNGRGAAPNSVDLIRRESQNELTGETNTFYVDSTIGSDTFDGLSPSYADGHGPKRNIYAAISAANDGKTIQVAPGFYEEGNWNEGRNWDLGAKNLMLCPSGSVVIVNNYSTLNDGLPDWWKINNGFPVDDPTVANARNSNDAAHWLTNLQVYRNPSVLVEDGYSTLGDIPDWWKITYDFSVTDTNVAGADPDGDGVTNSNEYQNGTSPLDYYNGVLPNLSVVSGDGQSGTTNSFLPQPLVVSVMDASEVPLTNAPVTFMVSEGIGQLARATNGFPVTSSLATRTDTNGQAWVFFRMPTTWGDVNLITATLTSGESTTQVVFGASSQEVADSHQGALFYGGLGAHCETEDAVGLSDDEFTIEFWFRSSGIDESVVPLIISDQNGAARYISMVNDGTNTGTIGLYDRYGWDVNSVVVAQWVPDVFNGLWHHLAAVRTPGVSTKLYLDGNLIGTGYPQSYSLGETFVRIGSDYPTESIIVMGLRRMSDDNPGEILAPSFHGAIDEVRLSRTARYQEEFVPEKDFEFDLDTLAYWKFNDGSGTNVLDETRQHPLTLFGPPLPIWVKGVRDTGLLGWWKLDEGSGTNAEDSSGNMLNGVLEGNPFWISGVVSNALQFDGAQDDLRISLGSSAPTNAMTVSAWVKGAPTATGIILERWSANSSAGSYQLSLTNGHVELSLSLMGQQVTLGGTTALVDTNWHHIAGTYDGTQMVVYMDGATNGSLSATGTIDVVAEPMLMGLFTGQMDDVRIYDRALSGEVIAALYDVLFEVDDDLDGIPNYWMVQQFGHRTGQASDQSRAIDDPDGDGLTNLQEYKAGTDPHDYYNGVTPRLNIVGGNNIPWVPGQFNVQPLLVSVTDTNNMALTNAPVTFTVTDGTGLLSAALDSGPLMGSVVLRTDTNGNAAGWFQLPATFDTTNQITVTATSGVGSTQVVFTVWTGSSTDDTDGDGMPDGWELANGLNPLSGILLGRTNLHMVGWWKLDDASGTNILNSAPGQTGGDGGAVNIDPVNDHVSGVFSNALQFNGTNAYVTIPHVPAFTTASGDFSVSFWIKNDGNRDQDHSVQRILTHGTDGNYAFWLDTYSPDGTNALYSVRFAVDATGGDGGDPVTILDGNVPLWLGVWYHVAASYHFVSNGSSEMKLYVNGVLVALRQDAVGPTFSTTGPITFGRQDKFGGFGYMFKGELDDVRYWTAALTADELANAFQDPDHDGLTNLQEMQIGTDPHNPDTNSDGIPDGVAIALGLSATATDMDGDGLSNSYEMLIGTNPLRADTDGDGVPDGQDAFPLDPTRWQAPTPDPNDHTPPTITLDEPTNAVVIQ